MKATEEGPLCRFDGAVPCTHLSSPEFVLVQELYWNKINVVAYIIARAEIQSSIRRSFASHFQLRQAAAFLRRCTMHNAQCTMHNAQCAMLILGVHKSGVHKA